MSPPPPSRASRLASVIVPVAAFLYFLLRYRSPAYCAAGLVLLGVFFILFRAREKSAQRPFGILALIVLGTALPGLGIWQYLQMRDIGDLDHATYATALWNFRHGFLHYDFRETNILGVHSQYTAFFWIPIQYLFGETGLKAGKGLCLLAAVFLVLRRFKEDRGPAAWAGAAILLSPPIASQFFFGFHPEFIAAPVLVLALEAYRGEKLGRFLACTAFLAFSKEVFTLAVGGLLLVALIERRPWKWLVLPGALCCLQMAVYWFVVLPRFAPAGNGLGHYMPVSAAQILSMWMRPQTFFYAFHVFLPFLPLMLAFPKRYLLLPVPLMLFYAAFPDPLFTVLWPNYAFPLVFLCTGGLVLCKQLRIVAGPIRAGDNGLRGDHGPPSAEERPSEAGGSAGSETITLEGRMLAACAVASLLCYPLWREIFSVPAGNPARAREVDRIRSLIPEGASLVVNAPFTARLAARKEVSIWGWRSKPLDHFEYAMVDAGFKPYWLVDEKDLARGLDSLAVSPEWIREYAQDDLFLFRHKRAAGLP
ncbi:MAG: Protein of unknown function rane [Fibrobacteres bacterium]|nr:Protein of unknown function rane [Fibrobacterota bacterium]